MKKTSNICPICGYDDLQLLSENAFERCPCCGYEFGTFDYNGESLDKYFPDGKETDKVYDLSVIDQLTFIFKQNKTISWYSMFTYLTKTTDTSVVADKNYYTAVEPVTENSYECTARIVTEPDSNPAKA